jgi:methanogen homocitrate synthase
VHLSPQKPIVGSNAFKRESGVVTSQLYTYPPAIEAYDPAIFGRETDVVLGKKSGKSSIKYFLNKLGYAPLEEDEIQELTLKVKEFSLEKRRCLKENEFIDLLERYSLRKSL